MKVTIFDIGPEEETEIIVKCHEMDENMIKLIKLLKQKNNKLNVYRDGKIHFIESEEVYYFESVDQKVFVYGKDDVYETKSKLYELEEELPSKNFFRATKSTILNISMIKNLTPAFGGRFEEIGRASCRERV